MGRKLMLESLSTSKAKATMRTVYALYVYGC